MKGRVYLIGAGPGDPGLITARGLECIRRADVLVYDYLAAPALLQQAAPGAEMLYVGKKGGDHTLSQDAINALLVDKARGGLTIARLKGGDPFIFGRGGEEAEVLAAAGIDFEVVPGVTSAVAAAAYAGIPLTHRRLTSTVAFVTGHEDPTKDDSSIHWGSLADGIGTLVFLMGVKNLARIVGRLRDRGLPAEKPVAVIRWGTTPRQVTVTGTLANIVARVQQAGVTAPAIIVVGDVVGLRPKLRWFEKRPLLGKTIIVTRARSQASDLVSRLSALGAECLECPTIRIEPPDDPAPLDAAVDFLKDYDWLVFTSVNGVRFFFERLFQRGLDARALGHLQTASIGPATAAELRGHGLGSDIVPQTYRAESIVAAFRQQNLAGKRILLPRAMEARPVLPVELTRLGAEVNEVPAYCTRQDGAQAGWLLERLGAGSVDLVTFTSSSTARNFKALLPAARVAELMRGVLTASIGPVTAATAAELGFTVDIVAAEYTIPGLCEAIREHLAPLGS